MNGLGKASAVLPWELQDRLLQLPLSQALRIQEIRLRRRQPVTFTGGGSTWYLSVENTLTVNPKEAILCKEEWLEKTLDNACGHSLYTHQEELRKGYVSTREGCRIGVVGTAVLQEGEVCSFREISSLCIRVSRGHRGCAKELFSIVYAEKRVRSALICGEPACGKTSLLKDLLHNFSQYHLYPTVVDERGELKEYAMECGCDVLCGLPKAVGIEQAVRCLAPPLIVLDELGDGEDITAVTDGLYRGVPAIATVHCREERQLLQMKNLHVALENGVFEYLFFLHGRERPSEIRSYSKTEEWLRERLGDVAVVSGGVNGRYCGTNTVATTGNRVNGSEKSHSPSA